MRRDKLNILILLFQLIFVPTTLIGSSTKIFVNPDSLINAKNKEANIFYGEGYYFKAESLLNEVLELKKIYQSDNMLNIANTLTNIGIMNKRTFRTNRALEYYDQAEIIYKNLGNQPGYLASLYYNKGSLYFINKDYYKCERYLNEVRSILDTIRIPNFVNESVIYSLLGSVNLQKKNFGKAYENFKIAEQIAKSDLGVLLNVYDNIIYAYLGLDEFEKEIADIVKSFLDKMKIVIDSEHNLPKKIDYYLFQGKYNYRIDPNNPLTFEYYKKALEVLNNNYDSHHPLYNNVYRFIIDYFFERGNYLMTLEYVQRAFENLSSDFKSDNFYNNPDPNTFSDYSPVFFHLRYKTLALMHLYRDIKDLNYLYYAKENADYTLSLLEELKWKYDHENHKYYISEAETEIFKIAEYIHFELYNQTREKEYLSRCFELNERGKAFSLLINIRSEQAMQFGGIPPELIREESEIIEKLSAFTELIMTERASMSPNTKKMRTWENSIFELNNEHEKLIKFFENNYPEYYRLKYDTRVINPAQVSENLHSDEIMVEYSLTDSTLITYLVTKRGFNAIEQRVDTTFRDLCLNYYSTLTNQSFSYGVKKTFENYTRDAHQLYRVLVQPIEEYIEDKNIILIPDGEISYVSFEALLTRPVDAESSNYYRLPYLVLDHGFSNSFSATVHFMEPVKKNKPKKGILAYAPSYSNISAQNINMELLRQSDVEKLIRIPGVKEEVNRISNFMHADVFQDYNATESSFKAKAPDYKVLHLAMHTILDDKDPLYSKLAFTQLIDTIDDGFLHTYEIYNMQINAELAVLSSCNSGFGELQEGEGIQSLARGFAYAGCPSIVMTLWEVADNSTVELMEKFYYYLDMGFTKSEALHQSKIDFLANADELKSNPFFWSSFVLVGDTKPVYMKKAMVGFMNAGILLIPLPLLFFFYQNYRKKIRRKS